jgi:hypothetical protein
MMRLMSAAGPWLGITRAVDELALRLSDWPDVEQAEAELRQALIDSFQLHSPEVSEVRAFGLSFGLTALTGVCGRKSFRLPLCLPELQPSWEIPDQRRIWAMRIQVDALWTLSADAYERRQSPRQ